MSEQERASTLVVVAHPMDETLFFSTVCAGADVIAVREEGGPEWSEKRTAAFHAACEALGARRGEVRGLTGLKGLGDYARVYTHSPQEDSAWHREVCLAVSREYGTLRVPALSACPTEGGLLDEESFLRKLSVLDGPYGEGGGCASPLGGLPGVEAFTRVEREDVVRTLSLTKPEIHAELADPWCFATSPYERERYELTARLLGELATRGAAPKHIIDLGACEGRMTERLLESFPGARVEAVESEPHFSARLRERLGGEARVRVVEASALEVPLEADLVVMAEVLYYLPSESLRGLVGRVSARHLLTSYGGGFGEEVAALLREAGWREELSGTVPTRLEPVDGVSSPLWIRRAGTEVRLWSRATSG